jgi:protein TonB
LAARYESIEPNDARKKAVTAWGVKPEPETPAVAATASAAKPTEAAKPAEPVKAAPLTPATAAAPAPGRPVPAPAKPASEPARPAAEPKPAAAPAPDPAAVAAAQQARLDKERQQAELYNQYLGQVRKQVLRKIDYPRRAQKENIEGLVVLRINLDRNGNVASSEVAQTADDLLDASAVTAVQKAAPYPKPPEQLEGERFEILVPVVFKLTQ